MSTANNPRRRRLGKKKRDIQTSIEYVLWLLYRQNLQNSGELDNDAAIGAFVRSFERNEVSMRSAKKLFSDLLIKADLEITKFVALVNEAKKLSPSLQAFLPVIRRATPQIKDNIHDFRELYDAARDVYNKQLSLGSVDGTKGEVTDNIEIGTVPKDTSTAKLEVNEAQGGKAELEEDKDAVGGDSDGEGKPKVPTPATVPINSSQPKVENPQSARKLDFDEAEEEEEEKEEIRLQEKKEDGGSDALTGGKNDFENGGDENGGDEKEGAEATDSGASSGTMADLPTDSGAFSGTIADLPIAKGAPVVDSGTQTGPPIPPLPPKKRSRVSLNDENIRILSQIYFNPDYKGLTVEDVIKLAKEADPGGGRDPDDPGGDDPYSYENVARWMLTAKRSKLSNQSMSPQLNNLISKFKFPFRVIHHAAVEKFLLTVDFGSFMKFVRDHHPDLIRTSAVLSISPTALLSHSKSLIEYWGAKIAINTLMYPSDNLKHQDLSDEYQEILMCVLGFVLSAAVTPGLSVRGGSHSYAEATSRQITDIENARKMAGSQHVTTNVGGRIGHSAPMALRNLGENDGDSVVYGKGTRIVPL